MNNFLGRLVDFNRKWKDIPRRAGIVLLTCLCLGICCVAIKYLAPFVCALVFSCAIRPLAKPLEKLFTRIRISPRIGALIAVVLVFGVLATLFIMLIAILTGEVQDLIAAMPGFINDVSIYIKEKVVWGTELIQAQAGDEALNTIYDMLMTGLNRLTEVASSLAAGLVSFTWSAMSSIPNVILVVLFTIMESYYIVADRDDIGRFFRRWMPDGISGRFDQVKKAMLKGVRAQIVTALLQMLAAAVVLTVGFVIIDVKYSLIMAMLIAALDALPVIGAGLIMFPMIGYYLIVGKYMMALGVMVLYLVIQVVKRVLEPKILGNQMKMHQLATMISMYAGYALMGFIGMIIGPLMLMLFSVVLEITDITEIKEIPEPARKEGE
jgi:sporulation integral membrane protein YtvI